MEIEKLHAGNKIFYRINELRRDIDILKKTNIIMYLRESEISFGVQSRNGILSNAHYVYHTGIDYHKDPYIRSRIIAKIKLVRRYLKQLREL